MEKRPVAAYMLSMIGLCLQVVAAVYIVYMIVFFSSVAADWGFHWENMGPWMMGHWMRGYPYTLHPLWSLVWIITAVAVIAIGAYGIVLMNSTNLGSVRTGATLVLIASIIAFPTMWGFMIGSLLMFAGSILGLVWAPPRSQTS